MSHEKIKWYFVYKRLVDFAYERRPKVVEEVEFLLNSTNEDERIKEAETIWAGIVKKANEEWERQKKEWEDPPQKSFNDTPPNPRVIYKLE